MPLLDISDVTSSLVKLIEEAFRASPAWTHPDPAVIPEIPTDQLDIGHNVVGIYLYHVYEKKEYSNFPIPGNDLPASRFLPMAISLYYQLSARHYQEIQDGKNAYDEQLMMGIAMKALHDYPVLDDSSTINSVTIFQGELPGKENRFRISQQPIPYTDAVHNWTAGQSPMKLSAYYELATVFLEPEEITSYSARVLTYGNYVFVKGAPRITGSQNMISFLLPGDPVVRQVKIQPAQGSPAKDPPVPVTTGSIISFFGSGFEGDEMQVRIFHAGWTEPVIAAASWNVTLITADRLVLTVREKAALQSNGASVDVLPGMYSAQVIVTRLVQLPNGERRSFSNSSNQFPFIISPRVDTISALAGSIVTITGYIFQYIVGVNDILAAKIDVYLGQNRLIRNSVALFSIGEFRVINATTVEINIPGPLTAGREIPLRILIDGAESPPAWITI